jgi:hypothetical protein
MKRAIAYIFLSFACLASCSLTHPLDGFAGGSAEEAPPPSVATSAPGDDATANAPASSDGGASRDGSRASVPDDVTSRTPTEGTPHFLYSIGGSFTEDLFQDNVYYAPILDDGSLGDWDVTTPLPTGIRNHATVVHGNDLYVIGGEYTGGALSADVQVTTFLPNGKLGPWKVFRGVLGSGRKDHAATVAGDSLYVGGGFDGIQSLRSILRATLMPASLGSFAIASNYEEGLRVHAMATVGSMVVSTGGATPTSYIPDIVAFPIGLGGALESSTKLAQLPVALGYHRTVVVGSTLYLVGGVTATTEQETNVVYSATSERANSLSAWTRAGDFRGARWRHAVVGAFGSIYLGGGRVGTSTTTALLSDIQIARVLTNMTLEWRTSPRALPKALASHAFVVH